MMGKGQRRRDSSSSSNGVERKTIEKNRRMHMKGLCFKLASLVPRNHHVAAEAAAALHKEELTQLDHLDEATAYIKKLQARLEDLGRRKQAALGGSVVPNGHHQQQQQQEVELPVVDVRVVDTMLEVVLVSPSHSANSFLLFYQVTAALEQQGTNIANASFSVVKDKIFCTVHAQLDLPESNMGPFVLGVTNTLNNLLR